MPNTNRNSKIHFEISERRVLLRLIDIISVAAAMILLGQIFHIEYFNKIYNSWTYGLVLVLYLSAIGSIFEIYNLQIASNQFQSIKNVLLTSSLTVLFYILTPLYTPDLPNKRVEILFFYLAVVVPIFVWRMIYVRYFAANRFKKNAILVAESKDCQKLVKDLGLNDPHYTVVGYVNINIAAYESEDSPNLKKVNSENIEKFVVENNVSDIIIATKETSEISINIYNQLIKLLESGYNIKEYSHLYEQLNQRMPVQYLEKDFFKYFPFSRSNQNRLYQFSARAIDILFSIAGLIVMIVLIPIVVIINLVANNGKLFYTQQRVGLNGENFKIFKFRTMTKNSEKDGAVFSTVNDIRVTPFGKFMRKTRIDEFPQFINILKGEMSLIGPRPERPIFVDQIAQNMPFYTTRHVIKPGLTGWAQVNYPYGETLEHSLIKLQYDLYYIKHRNIFMDIDIMVKTLSTVLFYRGQ